MSGIVFIISAPSGSGKTTLTNELRKIVGDGHVGGGLAGRGGGGAPSTGRQHQAKHQGGEGHEHGDDGQGSQAARRPPDRNGAGLPQDGGGFDRRQGERRGRPAGARRTGRGRGGRRALR